MKCFRVIGTPQESEWPENVSLNWSFFAQHHSVPLESLLPEICEQGQNILQVLLFCGLACVNVFMYVPYLRVPSVHLYHLIAVTCAWEMSFCYCTTGL
jgi:hypothetical protein